MDLNSVFICLTPVKNEAWILESFIKCNSLWADYIIILDQLSTDNTKEICSKYPNVIWVENSSKEYNEAERQNLLIKEARKLPGNNKIFIALDADEILSSNLLKSKEWEEIKKLPKGTIIKFPWFNINSDKKGGWFAKSKVPFGFVDDGSEHYALKIHSTRIPTPQGAQIYETNDIVNLHFQYIDPERNRKKQRWYMCWERINFPEKHPIDIFRQYNVHMSVSESNRSDINPDWTSGYGKEGLEIFNCKGPELTWWDVEILEMFQKFGTDRFLVLDIWDCNWLKKSHECQREIPSLNENKSRLIDRWALSWLKYSQKKRNTIYNRLLQRSLRSIWN